MGCYTQKEQTLELVRRLGEMHLERPVYGNCKLVVFFGVWSFISSEVFYGLILPLF
jgi:hypothetical protein